jgi:hypothetical protein
LEIKSSYFCGMQISKWPSDWIVFLGYLPFALAVYWQMLPSWFVSDDFHFLYEMEVFGHASILNNFNDAFFIPLAHLYGYLLWIVFKLNSAGYNIAGLLLHTTNAFLFYILLRKLYCWFSPLLIGQSYRLVFKSKNI